MKTGISDFFCGAWGEGASWVSAPDGGPPEADTLLLGCEKLEARLGWRPLWGIQTAVEKTVEWAKCHAAGEDAAGELAALLERPAIWGSIQKGEITC